VPSQREPIDAHLEFVKAELRLWDPIGVLPDEGDSPARDEYDAYAPQILSLLMNGADAQVIADRLDHIRVRLMGLFPDRPRDEQAAERLVREWKDRACSLPS
jgi:hypothetical protein